MCTSVNLTLSPAGAVRNRIGFAESRSNQSKQLSHTRDARALTHTRDARALTHIYKHNVNTTALTFDFLFFFFPSSSYKDPINTM